MNTVPGSLFVLLTVSLVTADRLAVLKQRIDRVEAENVHLKKQIEQLAAAHSESQEKLDKIVEEKDELEERVAKLEELSRVNVLRSCAEYQQYGFSRSGFYLVDPDGSLIGHPPFQVKTNSAYLFIY